MKTLTDEQQRLFDQETTGLVHLFVNVSDEFIESLGFSMVRFHSLQNLRGEDAEMEVFEHQDGRRVVKLCVTQVTHTEGELLHITCYADDLTRPLLEKESNKYRNGSTN